MKLWKYHNGSCNHIHSPLRNHYCLQLNQIKNHGWNHRLIIKKSNMGGSQILVLQDTAVRSPENNLDTSPYVR